MENFDPIEKANYICNIGPKIRSYFLGRILPRTDFRTETGKIEFLSPRQLRLLEIVIADDQLTTTGLAKKMNVSPPSVSAMVDRMVKCGWLHRDSNAQDRRKVIIHASAKAKKYIICIQQSLREEIIHLIQAIGPETTKKWCDVLSEIERVCSRTQL